MTRPPYHETEYPDSSAKMVPTIEQCLPQDSQERQGTKSPTERMIDDLTWALGAAEGILVIVLLAAWAASRWG